MAPNLSKHNGLKDPEYLKAYSAIKSVVEMDPTLAEKVDIPALVITGVQSVGKTSFIEAMVKTPLGFTDSNTGTRCPVRYILRTATDSAWAVGGVTLTKCEDVRVKVTEHMQKLAKKNEFSMEALKVEICGPDLPDMDITDLPGLQDGKEPSAPAIANIAMTYFADPNVIPVALCKAEKNQQTQLDITALEDIGFDANRGLIVVNYFNKRLGELHKASGLNKYCDGYFKKFKQVYFLMLHYKDGINKDEMTFAELQQFYSSLPENEAKTFQEKIRELEKAEPGVEVQGDVKKSLGINYVVGAMQRLLSGWMDNNRQRIVSVLQDKSCALSERLDVLKAGLEDQKPEILIALWEDYIHEWNTVMKGVYQAKHNYVKSQPKKTSAFAKKFDWAFDAEDPALVHTFDEEWDLLPEELKRKADFFPPLDVLREQLQGTKLGRSLDARLHPHAAFHRIVMLCDYVIMTYQMRPLTEDEVDSKNGYATDGMTGHFNKHTVIKDMVTERLFEIQDVVEVALLHIQKVYEAPLERVHGLLADRHPVVANHNGFKEEMSDVYKSLLHEQLKVANSFLQENVKMVTSLVAVDLPTRLISLLGLTPLRQDILKIDADVFETEIDNEQEGGDQMSLDGDGFAEFDAASDAALARPSQWLRTNNVATRQAKNNIPRAVRDHRGAVLDVKNTLHRVKEQFKCIDFVEGGCQDFVPEEWRCVDVEELNKEAEQYFVLLKGLLSLYGRASLNHHVYSFLSGDLLDGMEKEMRRKIHEIALSNEGAAIPEMTGGGQELETEKESVEEQLKLVEEALKQLDATGEVRPKGKASPPLVGGRCTAAPSRGELLSLQGLLEFPLMDLRKLPQKWANDFCRSAEQDIATHIGLHRQKVKVNIEGHVLKYALETPSPARKTEIRRKIQEGMKLPKCACLYCKCLNLSETKDNVEKIGTTKTTHPDSNAPTSSKLAHPDQEQQAGKAPGAQQEQQAGKAPGAQQEQQAGKAPGAQQEQQAGKAPDAQQEQQAGKAPGAQQEQQAGMASDAQQVGASTSYLNNATAFISRR